MCIVFVFRETTQVAIAIGVDRLVRLQIGIPRAIFGLPEITDDSRHITEVVSTAVVLGVVIAELVDKLQIYLTEDGLAIGDAGTIVPVLCRSETIAARVVRGVLCQLEEAHVTIVDRATFSLAPVTVELKGQVTTCRTEFTVELEHSTQIF